MLTHLRETNQPRSSNTNRCGRLSLTPTQRKHYWNTWNNVRRILVTKGWARSADVEDIRHEFTEKALGQAKSLPNLTHDEFQRVLAAFWEVSIPTGLEVSIAQLDLPTKRFLYEAYHLIDCAGDVENRNKASHLEAICHHFTGKSTPEVLLPSERKAVISALSQHVVDVRNRRKDAFGWSPTRAF